MNNYLKELCCLNGISGREEEVREYIVERVKGFKGCRYEIDPLGSVIVYKEGRKKSSCRIMLDSHMDEVGLMVTYVTEDGFLRFANVGGINENILPGKKVTVNGLTGVIGVTPVHLLDKDKKDKTPKIDEMYIDIGAFDREDAEKYVKPGDSVYFKSEFVLFGDGFIKSKAIDDRLGCAVLLEILESYDEYDYICTFSVQEETGCRGARVLAERIKPDYAIVLETTTASDIDGVRDEKRVCLTGEGAVVSFMDRGTVYNRKLFDLAFDIAKKNGIKAQTKTMVAGGNNAGAIHLSAGGIKTIALSAPCRYLHSPACVIKYEDAREIQKLAIKLLEEFAK